MTTIDFLDWAKVTADSTKKDPVKYYSSRNTITDDLFKVPKKTDEGKIQEGVFEGSKDDVSRFLNTYSIYNQKTFGNYLREEEHARDMFKMSIEDPVAYVSAKNAVQNSFGTTSKQLYKTIFEILVKSNASPIKAERDAGILAGEIYNKLVEYLNKEIYPSVLEDSINARRKNVAMTN